MLAYCNHPVPLGMRLRYRYIVCRAVCNLQNDMNVSHISEKLMSS